MNDASNETRRKRWRDGEEIQLETEVKIGKDRRLKIGKRQDLN